MSNDAGRAMATAATLAETRTIAGFPIEVSLLDGFDALAARRGCTRTALLRALIQEAVEHGGVPAGAPPPVSAIELRELSERLKAQTTELDRVLRQSARREGELVAARAEAADAAARNRATTLAAIERRVGEVLTPVGECVRMAADDGVAAAGERLIEASARLDRTVVQVGKALEANPTLRSIHDRLDRLDRAHEKVRPTINVTLGNQEFPGWAWLTAAGLLMVLGMMLIPVIGRNLPTPRVSVALATYALGPDRERLCVFLERHTGQDCKGVQSNGRAEHGKPKR